MIGTVRQILPEHSDEHASFSLEIQIYLTQTAEQAAAKLPNVPAELKSPKSVGQDILQDKGREVKVPYQETYGRPQLPEMIKQEAAESREANQSLGVFVCGPTTMQNDVRNAVAKENLDILQGSRTSGVYLHSEHFSWA